MSWLSHSLVELIGLTLLHFLWQGALIGALYAASLPLSQTADSRTRYAIAVVALAALALAPLFTLAVLGITAAGAGGAAAVLEPLPVLRIGAADTQAGTSSPMFWVVTAWSVGVALLSLRLLLGWRYLCRLRKQADYQAAAPLIGTLARLGQGLGIRRSVAIAVSCGIRSPVVVGWLKPLVLLPPAIMTGLPARQIDMILAHELAHIRRFDHLINLLQTMVETVLFYHPVVRWVSHRIRIERENACDDLAIAVTADRLAYVEMLAALETIRYQGPRLALAMHDGQMLSRIRRLVEQSRPGQQLGLTVPILAAALMLAAAGGLQMLPEEIFDESAPPESEPTQLNEAQATVSDPLEQTLAALEPAGQTAEPVQPEQTGHAPATPSAGFEPVLEAQAGELAASEERAATTPPALPQAPIERLPPVEELFTQTDSMTLALLDPPRPVLGALPEARPATERLKPQITGGELVKRIEPDYPVRARRRGINGSVLVDFLVTPQGRVSQLKVIEEQPGGMAFAEAAAEAIAQWRFEPYRQDGETIAHRMQLEVDFTLGHNRGCRAELGTRIARC